MSNLYWLTEAQMQRLRPYFPKSRGRARVDDRRVLSGIIFINRNGLRWCDALVVYGPDVFPVASAVISSLCSGFGPLLTVGDTPAG